MSATMMRTPTRRESTRRRGPNACWRPEPDLISVTDAARLLGVCRNTIFSMLRAGLFDGGEMIGHRRKVSLAAIQAYREAQRERAS